MKKTLAIAMALVCCLGLLAACGEPASDPSEAPASEAPASEAPASEAPSSEPIELSGTIVVNGSTSMGDVINALTEGFNELHPDVQISYTGSGSSAGIEAALAGSCDLGLSSRELSDDELSQGAVANVIAKDGVAVVVNPENPVTELTSEQIAKIFTGEITNWSELGGEDARSPCSAVTPPPAPAAPSRRSSASRTSACTSTSTPPPATSSAMSPRTPTPSATPPSPLSMRASPP